MVIELQTWRIVHAAVTYSPTGDWTAQQLREATPWGWLVWATRSRPSQPPFGKGVPGNVSFSKVKRCIKWVQGALYPSEKPPMQVYDRGPGVFCACGLWRSAVIVG